MLYIKANFDDGAPFEAYAIDGADAARKTDWLNELGASITIHNWEVVA